MLPLSTQYALAWREALKDGVEAGCILLAMGFSNGLMFVARNEVVPRNEPRVAVLQRVSPSIFVHEKGCSTRAPISAQHLRVSSEPPPPVQACHRV